MPEYALSVSTKTRFPSPEKKKRTAPALSKLSFDSHKRVEFWRQKQQRGGPIVKDLLAFAKQCRDESQLGSALRRDNPCIKRAIRQLSFYYHPDKYVNYIGIQPKEKKLLEETFLLFNVIKEAYIRQQQLDTLQTETGPMESRLADVLQRLHLSKNKRPNEDCSGEKKFRTIVSVEAACFAAIRQHYTILNERTQRFLLRTYGRIISLMMQLAIYYNQGDLLAEGIHRLEANLTILGRYAKKHNLEREFQDALLVEFNIDKDYLGMLNQFREELQVSYQQREQKNKTDRLGKAAGTGIGLAITTGFGISVSIVTAGAALPFFLAGLFLQAASGYKQQRINEQRTRVLDKAREDYYDAYFSGIAQNLVSLDTLITAKRCYHKFSEENKAKKINAEACLSKGVSEELRALRGSPSAKTWHDLERLQLLKQMHRDLQSRVNPEYVREDEKNALVSRGFNPRFIRSEKEAQLMRLLLRMNLSEEEQLTIQASSTAPHRLLLEWPEARLPLSYDTGETTNASETAEKNKKEEPSSNNQSSSNSLFANAVGFFTALKASLIEEPLFTQQETEKFDELGVEWKGASSQKEAGILLKLLQMPYTEEEKLTVSSARQFGVQ